MKLTWTLTPLFIAHRGLSAEYPENTMAAFDAAYAAGARSVEFDVQRAACGTPFIFHDDDLDRTSNGHGLATSKTWEELSKLDAGSWRDPKFASCKIPTLKEFIVWLKTHPMLVNIELKVPEDENCVELIKSIVIMIRSDWPKGCPLPVLSSFSNSSMESCFYIAPEIPRAILAEKDYVRHLKLAIKTKAEFINISENMANVEDINEATKRNIRINVFTVNDVHIAKKLIADGVNGVFSDNAPDLKAKYEARSKKKCSIM